MSDLWDFGPDEPELAALSDSDGEVKEVSDTDFLLPKAKRQKLQRQYKGRRSTKEDLGVPAEGAHDDDGADSDIDLLNSPPGPAAALRLQAAAGALAPGALLPRIQQQQPGAAAPRAVPLLDARSSDLLRQLKATQNAMKAAAAEVDLTQDADDDPTEPSPVHLRSAPRWAAQRQQQPAEEEPDDGDDDLQILEETLPGAAGAEAAAAAARAEDKIPLKLQSVRGVKEIRMRKTDPFSKMFEVYKKYALQVGWLKSLDAPVRFIFDGDQVAPDETPEGLDLEGEEMIEVRF